MPPQTQKQTKIPPKAATNKTGKYGLIPAFPGYHAREDPTTLAPGTLVSPSQNVLIKTSGRVALTQGYVLDGAGSSVIDSGILSNYDFITFRGDTRNMRAGFMSAAGNDGKLQYRYVGTTGTVNWVTLSSALTSVRLAFTSYWDTTNLVKDLLWVDGSSNVFAWNGAVTTFASATNSTGYISVLNPTPTAGGSSYTVGDILTITGGTATAIVSAVSSGVVTTVALVSTGSGYSTGTGQATTGGTGTGATLNITTVVNNSFTNQGSVTWAQLGFAQTSGTVVIGGTQYSYAIAIGNKLVGIGSDPTIPGYSAGAIMHQAPITTALSAMASILATFSPTLIGCGIRNQVYLGSSISNNLYVSKVNNYQDYGFTSPTRVVGEGALIFLDAPPTAFIPSAVQKDTSDLSQDMYISSGLNSWGVIRSILSSDLTKETMQYWRLSVGQLQGAKSQRLVTNMKNHIMFVSNDNVANFLGYLSYKYVPVIVDFSYPIIDDMNSYDLTDASIFYHRNYAYIAIPKAGVVRVYNMTNQTQEQFSAYNPVEAVTQQPFFWEAPLTFPLSGFYEANGNLYGHSYVTSESYLLFSGGSLNGQSIDANATFAFDAKGDRTSSKGSNEIWIEGYIGQNTVLTATVAGDLDAFQSEQVVTVNGDDNSVVAYGSGAHSLGKNNLGTQSLGGANTTTSTLPAWFHVIKTYVQTPSYLEQVSFSSKGVDLAWELITYGTNASFTSEGNNALRQ